MYSSADGETGPSGSCSRKVPVAQTRGSLWPGPSTRKPAPGDAISESPLHVATSTVRLRVRSGRTTEALPLSADTFIPLATSLEEMVFLLRVGLGFVLMAPSLLALSRASSLLISLFISSTNTLGDIE